MQKNNRKILYRRFLNGTYTCDEAANFFSDVKNPAYRRQIENMASRIWKETDIPPFDTSIEEEKYKKEARLLLKRMEKKATRPLKPLLLAVGAAAAIVAIIFSLPYFFDKETPASAYTEIHTGFGEKKEFSLPDGSTVVLNACSRLCYPTEFTNRKQRDITLRGEAYFNVKKNTEKTFVVFTKHFEVQVIGTAFNVKSYENDELIKVDVERGKVKVDMEDASLQLAAQEQITINTLSGDFSKQRNDGEIALWRKGWLRFNRTPIRDVARELERVYNCRMVFREGQEFNNLISGEHDNQSLDAVLQSLEFASGIKYKKENNRILFYRKQ